jgi:zinc protease
MKKSSMLLAGLIALGLMAPVAEAGKGKMTAEQIIEKSIQAVGGRAAMSKIKSTVMKGTLQMQGVSGNFEVYQKAPNKYLFVQNLQGVGELKQGFDGKVGWAHDPFSGIRNLEGAELEMTKREATHNAALYWKQLYKKVELLGTRKVGSGTAYAIRMTPTKGKPVTQYFDTKNFLLVRVDVVVESPQGTIATETYFSNYRPVNGVKTPFMLKQRVSSIEVTLQVTEVKNNVPISDSIFKKPAK